MQVKPWHAFVLVAVLALIGRDFNLGGGEDFMYFVLGTLVWGGIIAGIIWFFTRKREKEG